ncbi:hypothetical protein LguiA_029893 [Lonicera macranthoides]
MLTCNCNKNTLAHESCSHQNNKNCYGCEQELRKLLVTLDLEPCSTHSRKRENKKGSLASRLQRVTHVPKWVSLLPSCSCNKRIMKS